MLLLAAFLAVPGGQAAEAGDVRAPSSEESVLSTLDQSASLRLRYTPVYRTGGQQDAGPGLTYSGLTLNDFGLQFSWFDAGWLGFSLAAEREGFSLFKSSSRVTGGGLLGASAGVTGRWTLGPLRLEVGAGYGFAQLPSFTSSFAPTLLPAQRHALELAGRLRIRLPLGMYGEARAGVPLSLVALDGQGQPASSTGAAVGAALAIPLTRVDAIGISLLVDVQLVSDRLVTGQSAVTSYQGLLQGGLAVELAWLPGVRRLAASVEPSTEVQAPREVQSGSVVMSLVDKESGAPIPGAVVTLQGKETPVGPAGQVTVRELPPGPVEISVTAEGYQPAREVASVVAGKEAPVSVAMVKIAAGLPATLTGLVRSTQGGKPIPALLEIPEAKVRTKASPSGAFTIKLSGGTYTVVISAPGYLPQHKRVKVKDGEEAIFNVDLHPERHR